MQILITGGNAGIGKATAIQLAKQGHRIVLACRNEAKAKDAIAAIRAASNNKNIHFLHCDLASLPSVRNCAKHYRNQFGELDILINNAGLITDKLLFTKDGFELQFGVNHLGHFLLTTSLIDLLEQAKEPRVINVSSKAHLRAKINFNTFNGEIGEQRYKPMAAYGQSKLANVLFTKELIRRHPNIYSFSLHPGVVATQIAGKNGNKTSWRIIWSLFSPFFKSTDTGAKTSVYLATSPSALSSNGKYFDSQKVAKASPLANDEDLARKLWETSETLIRTNK